MHNQFKRYFFVQVDTHNSKLLALELIVTTNSIQNGFGRKSIAFFVFLLLKMAILAENGARNSNIFNIIVQLFWELSLHIVTLFCFHYPTFLTNILAKSSDRPPEFY